MQLAARTLITSAPPVSSSSVKLAARPDASVSRVGSRRKKRSVLALRCDAGGLVSPPDSGSVREWIETNVDGAGAVTNVQERGGSGWAQCSAYDTVSGRKFFVKTSARDPSMFAGEGAGLKALHATRTLVVPRVYYAGALPEGSRDGNSCIVMDHLNFGPRGDQAEFGRQLALMHVAEPEVAEARGGMFGFSVNNTIGESPQPNGWMDDWVEFFRVRRIGHQLKLARDPAMSALGAEVMARMPRWFEGIGSVRPAILHGDLWSGNIGTVDGAPAVFDPAVYYGHSEADFGMSWCAGFSDAFYDAYFEVLPKQERGFEERRQLYLLYHYLNHYNLFGGGYRGQCVDIMKCLVR